MTPEESRILFELHSSVNKMEPVLRGVAETQKEHDLRIRFVETREEQHDVKIVNLGREIDALQKNRRRENFTAPAHDAAKTGIMLRSGAFIVENWREILIFVMFGAGSINILIGLLHKIPLIPVPQVVSHGP